MSPWNPTPKYWNPHHKEPAVENESNNPQPGAPRAGDVGIDTSSQKDFTTDALVTMKAATYHEELAAAFAAGKAAGKAEGFAEARIKAANTVEDFYIQYNDVTGLVEKIRAIQPEGKR